MWQGFIYTHEENALNRVEVAAAAVVVVRKQENFKPFLVLHCFILICIAWEAKRQD